MPRYLAPAVLAFVLVSFLTAKSASASLIATDNEGSYSSPESPYVAGSDFNGLNGGTGFGPWSNSISGTASGGTGGTYGSGGNGGAFLAATDTGHSSTYLTSSSIAAFDIYNNGDPAGNGSAGTAALNNSITTAVRPFIAGSDGNTYIEAGQTFTFSVSMNNGTGGGATANQEGWELLDSNGNPLLNIFTNESATSSNSGATGVDITDDLVTGASLSGLGRINASAEQFTIAFTGYGLDSSNNPVLDYNITGAGHHGFSGYTGAISMATGGAVSFAMYDNDGGNGSDVQAGGLSITGTGTAIPEPVGLGLLALPALLLRRRASASRGS